MAEEVCPHAPVAVVGVGLGQHLGMPSRVS